MAISCDSRSKAEYLCGVSFSGSQVHLCLGEGEGNGLFDSCDKRHSNLIDGLESPIESPFGILSWILDGESQKAFPNLKSVEKTRDFLSPHSIQHLLGAGMPNIVRQPTETGGHWKPHLNSISSTYVHNSGTKGGNNIIGLSFVGIIHGYLLLPCLLPLASAHPRQHCQGRQYSGIYFGK